MQKRGNRKQQLTRDFAGYVHTGRGFLRRVDYEKIVRENPDAGLPEYVDIPLIDMPEYNPSLDIDS